MPKYEDLDFLKNKILNIGNEVEIIKEKNKSLNTASLPEKIKDSQIDIEKEILDESKDLVKDITEGFDDILNIEDENFDKIETPQESIEDFLSTLTPKDVTKEEDILGTDSIDAEPIEDISIGNISEESILGDQETKKEDWDELKEESFSDLDSLNMENLLQEDAGTVNKEEINNDELFSKEPVFKEDEADISSIFEEPVAETKSEVDDLLNTSQEFNLDNISGNNDTGFDAFENLLNESTESQEPKVEEPKKKSKKEEKTVEDGLVDLAGSFAAQEMTEEEKPPVIDQTLADLFTNDQKEETSFDDLVSKSEEENLFDEEPLSSKEDLLGDFTLDGFDEKGSSKEKEDSFDDLSFDEQLGFSEDFDLNKKPEGIKSGETAEDEFDFSDFENLSSLDEEEKSGGKKEEKKEAKKEEKPQKQKIDQKADKEYKLSDSDRKQIVLSLSHLPKEAELKISKAIVSGKYTDHQLKPLIGSLLDDDKPNIIYKVYERITGDKSLLKISASKFTGEEFEKQQKSFSYQFNKNILPIISKIAAASIFILFLFSIIVFFVLPYFEVSSEYNKGKENLIAKKFYDVETHFEKAYERQPRYKEVVEYARLYKNYKRFEEAEKKYYLALKMQPNTDLKIEIADFFRVKPDYDLSVRMYNEIIDKDRKNLKANLGLAKTYFDWSNEVQDKIKDSEKSYLDVLDIDEKNPDAVFGLLNIYIKEKNDKKIKTYYNYSEKNFKKVDPVVYSNYADYLLNQGNFDEIKNILQRAASSANGQILPEIDYLWAKYKKSLNINNEQKGHLESAIRKFELMSKKEPLRFEEPRYKRILSDVYNDLGENYDRYAKINIKAEEYYNKAIEADPEYGKSYYNLGNFALKHKVDLEAALSHYLEAESRGYENDTQTFNLGWLYYKKEDFMESFKRINSLLEKYPDNTNLKFMIGTIFYKLENYDLSESMQLELFSHYNDLKEIRSPLEMSKEEDKAIVNMLVRVANNLGCAMQKKYEQTRNSNYLVWATKYFGVSIENLGKLNEIPDTQQNANKEIEQLEYKKFSISNANQNLRMVLYPQAGVDDPFLFEDFPLDY